MKLEQFVKKNGLWLEFTRTTVTKTLIAQDGHRPPRPRKSWSAEIKFPIFDFPIFIEKDSREGKEPTAVPIIQNDCASKKEVRGKMVAAIRGTTIVVKNLDGIRRITVPGNLD